jgi:hypothetical protein
MLGKLRKDEKEVEGLQEVGVSPTLIKPVWGMIFKCPEPSV